MLGIALGAGVKSYKDSKTWKEDRDAKKEDREEMKKDRELSREVFAKIAEALGSPGAGGAQAPTTEAAPSATAPTGVSGQPPAAEKVKSGLGTFLGQL